MSTPLEPTRSDAPLIKFLAQPYDSGVAKEVRQVMQQVYPTWARRYNTLPLFLLPDETQELYRYQRDFDALLHMQPLRRPFEDLLLEFPCGWMNLSMAQSTPDIANLAKVKHIGKESGTIWTRVRSLADAAQDPGFRILCPNLPPIPANTYRDHLVIEGWQYLADRVPPGVMDAPDISAESKAMIQRIFGNLETNVMHESPTISVVPLNTAYAHATFWHVDQAYPFDGSPVEWVLGDELLSIEEEQQALTDPLANMTTYAQTARRRLTLSRTMSIASMLGLMYWMEVATTVKVQPTQPTGAKVAKTGKLKPWLLPRTAHYITVDLDRLGDYDHPSIRTVTGRHAPIPHRRRGHFRYFPANGRWQVDRTFVRESFIGDKAWSDEEGTSYTILPTF